MDVIKVLALNHILAAVAGTAFTLFLTLFFMKIFFVRRPSLRHLFLFAPLIKPLFILIGGVHAPQFSRPGLREMRVYLGTQLPDPMDLISTSHDRSWIFNRLLNPDAYDGASSPPVTTELFLKVLLVCGILLLTLIILRWAALYAYRKRLTESDDMDRAQYSRLYEAIENLSERFEVRVPKVVTADVSSPLMIGLFHCTVALPRRSLEHLTDEELEAMLAHEIAHIKRRDNAKLWIAIMCRDLMFFNPFAWTAYRLQAIERERAADYLAATTTGKPVELAGAIVKAAESLISVPMPQPALGIVRSDFAPKLSVTRRVDDLLRFKPHKRLVFRLLPLSILFLMLFYMRFHVSVRPLGKTFFSFFG